MNEERRAAVREVSEFIRRSAPPGAIKYAKTTEPFKGRIAQAQADAADQTVHLKTTMRRYAGAFFAAFRQYFDEQHPEPLTPEAVKAMTLAEIWHAGKRVTSIQCTSDVGDFSITPRTSSDPALQPSFSAAEISMLRGLGIANDLMVEAELIDAGPSVSETLRIIMMVKNVFPGALVTQVKDAMGDTSHLLPLVLQD
jgi:hypothetical protein